MTWAVTVEQVRAGYGAHEALHGVSLAVRPGEAVALLGPNGAGKTTLTRLLPGLLRPTSGRVAVGDWNVAARRPDEMARRVGYVFQHADQQLFARTVRDDVAFGPAILGLPRGAVDEVLAELDLTRHAARHPYDLPAPLRKVVTLAGVLAMAPGVLVLDEPTAGFDPSLRALVVDVVRRRLAAGVTVLAVSHDLEFVAEVADRIVVISGGTVSVDRRARELLTDAVALAQLGLMPPAAAAIGLALGATDRPVRSAEAVALLRGARWLGGS